MNFCRNSVENSRPWGLDFLDFEILDGFKWVEAVEYH